MEHQAQSALVTGTSSGLGKAIAEGLARAGFRVFATMRDPNGRNQRATADFEALAAAEGCTIDVLELDVCDGASVEAAIGEAAKRAGRLDVVVNNAGVSSVGWIEGFTDAALMKLLQTNALGVHRVIRAAAPVMRAGGGGLIINVSSMGGRLLAPFMGAYSVSKFAMEALCEAYARELYGLGIDCVILEPGGYGTALFDKLGEPDDPQRLEAYGELASVPTQVFDAQRAYYQSPDAPPVTQVADAVLHCIRTPAGERPLRTIVGSDIAFLAPVNDAADVATEDLLKQMQLTELLGR